MLPAVWHAFTQGDKPAFTRLYHHFFSDLFTYGMHLSRDKAVVKECIQDLFVTLWSRRSELVSVRDIPAYLVRAMRNRMLTRLSSRTTLIFDELEEENYDFEITYPVVHRLIRDEQHALLYAHFKVAVKKLTPRQREMIYLRYMKGMSYEAVCDIMQISVKAGYKLMARSLETLRENLQHIPGIRHWWTLLLMMAGAVGL